MTAIGRLPVNQAVVVTLRFVEGMNTREIADRLGIAETNVRVRLHRGLQTLKDDSWARRSQGGD